MALPALSAPMAQVGSGIIGGIVGLINQGRQNRANKKLAEYAYSKDLEMWNRNNVYNSPEAQMQRLKDAGLNPALVYGQGAVGNASGSMPKYNAPTMDYSYIPPIQEIGVGSINAYQDFQLKQAQIDNAREQNKILQEEGKIRAFKNWFNDQTKQPRVDIEYSKSWTQDEIRALKWQQREKQAGELGWLLGSTDGKTTNQQRLLEYQMDAKAAQVDKQRKDIEKIDLDMDYKRKQLEYYMFNTLMPWAAKGISGLKRAFQGPGKGSTAPGATRAQKAAAEKWNKFEKSYKQHRFGE